MQLTDDRIRVSKQSNGYLLYTVTPMCPTTKIDDIYKKFNVQTQISETYGLEKYSFPSERRTGGLKDVLEHESVFFAVRSLIAVFAYLDEALNLHCRNAQSRMDTEEFTYEASLIITIPVLLGSPFPVGSN